MKAAIEATEVIVPSNNPPLLTNTFISVHLSLSNQTKMVFFYFDPDIPSQITQVHFRHKFQIDHYSPIFANKVIVK